jgi:hypothetical protein
MRQIVIVPVLAALALAGCKQDAAPGAGASATPAAEAAAPGAGLPKPTPGLYTSTMKLVRLEAPGLPPQALSSMKQAIAKGQEGQNSFCLTGEEASRGYEERVKKLAGRPDCTMDRYSAAGGTLDAAFSCKGDNGMKSVMTMKGMMTPTSSDVTMSMEQSGAQMPGGSMKMTMNIKSERVGECK